MVGDLSESDEPTTPMDDAVAAPVQAAVPVDDAVRNSNSTTGSETDSGTGSDTDSVFERIVHEPHHPRGEAPAPDALAAPPAPTDEELLDRALEQLSAEDGVVARVDDRLIRIDHPVPGSPHLAALQALGFAAKVKPVGAAAHGPLGVAAAVWDRPLLYIARWTGTSRWVAAYKFPMRARPDEYLREDSGIPSHLSKGSWYADVPDEITEAFFAVGLLLDEPPYDVPKAAAKAPPPEPQVRAPLARSPRAPRTSGSNPAPRPVTAPRAPRPRAAPAPKKAVVTTRTCTMCNLQKHVSQFIEGSEWCVDCR